MNIGDFRILNALCRIGLGAANPAFRHQVEHMIESLREHGDNKQAEALLKLLKEPPLDQSMKPSQLIASAMLPGEALTRNAAPPADKETGIELADVVFPPREAALPPVLSPTLSDAIA